MTHYVRQRCQDVLLQWLYYYDMAWIQTKQRHSLWQPKGAGHIQVFNKFLLDAGAEIKMRSSRGKTVLHHAVQGEKPKMVSWLLDHGEDIESQKFNSNSYTVNRRGRGGQPGDFQYVS